MRLCKYCGTELAENASCCGQCGRTVSGTEEAPTALSVPPAATPPDNETAIAISTPNPYATIARPVEEEETVSDWGQTLPEGDIEQLVADYQTQAVSEGLLEEADTLQITTKTPEEADTLQMDSRSLAEASTMQMPADEQPEQEVPQEEEEEEKRKRAALIGLALPLAASGQAVVNTVPMVQGSLPAAVPQVQGAPSPPGEAEAAQAGSAPTGAAGGGGGPLILPGPITPLPSQPVRPPRPPAGGPSGLLVFTAVTLITLVLLLGSGVAAALTIWAPTLAILGGSSSVSAGGVLHLHGEHFLPGSSVTLTLDGHIPLAFSRPPVPSWPGTSEKLFTALAPQPVAGAWQRLAGAFIHTRGDGTFDLTLTVDPSWSPGQHTIVAQEQATPRTASLTFTVLPPGVTPTASATVASSPTVGTTATPTASPSATSAPTVSGLTCVNPDAVTLGPVSTGYDQGVTQTISLCAASSGPVNWTASWDSEQAPWLRLSTTSGQIAAAGEQQISVSASPGQLSAGSYTATVRFTDNQGNPAQTLTVTLNVVNACINASVATLNFSGIASVSDPAAQSFTIHNCGGLEKWSAALQLETTTDWLNLSSNSGTLNSGAATTLIASASVLGSELESGTYHGKILLTSGPALFTITVTLTVQPAPLLTLISPESGSIQANTSCTYTTANWTCNVIIAASSANPVALQWSAGSSGITGITFSPGSGSLGPGQRVEIQVVVPTNSCQTPATLSFTGPANTVNVTWSCTPVIS